MLNRVYSASFRYTETVFITPLLSSMLLLPRCARRSPLGFRLWKRSLCALALWVLLPLASAQLVVPRFAAEADVPEDVISRLTVLLRRQLQEATGLELRDSSLIPPALLRILEPEFLYLIADLGLGRYAVAGVIQPVYNEQGAPLPGHYLLRFMVADAAQQRSSALLQQSVQQRDLLANARQISDSIAAFIDPSTDPEARSVTRRAELFVTSQPREADIYLADVLIGRTPQIVQLSPGRYRIELRKEGFVPHFDTVDLSADRLEFINAALTPLRGGSIQVSSIPPARVFLEDRFVGSSPLTFTARPGERTLRLERPGFRPQHVRVDVRNFRVSRVATRLEPLSDTMLFWTLPPGFRLFINNVLQSREFLIGLQPGVYSIDLRSNSRHIRFDIDFEAPGIYELNFSNQSLQRYSF